MIDRIIEFRQLANIDAPVPVKQTKHIDKFFQLIKIAQRYLKEVEQGSIEISQQSEQLQRSVVSEQETQIKDTVKQLVSRNNGLLAQVRKAVDDTKSRIDQFSQQDNSAEKKMMTTNHATLVKQFQTALTDFERAQNDFSQVVRQKISNQVHMFDPNATEETVNKCMENPQMVQQLAQSQLIGAHEDVIRAVRNIEDRYQDVIMIEQNVIKLHKMFQDLATLVYSQGELLNSIEKHVNKAVEYVQKGVQEIQQAGEYQKSARWKKCCILVIVLVVLMVIVFPAVFAT